MLRSKTVPLSSEQSEERSPERSEGRDSSEGHKGASEGHSYVGKNIYRDGVMHV